MSIVASGLKFLRALPWYEIPEFCLPLQVSSDRALPHTDSITTRSLRELIYSVKCLTFFGVGSGGVQIARMGTTPAISTD